MPFRTWVRRHVPYEHRIRIRRAYARYSMDALREHVRADTFVISFPKCGRTWLRVLLTRTLRNHFGLTAPDWVDLEELHRFGKKLPRICVTHDDDPHWKTPHQLNRLKLRCLRKRVIFLVRDPRDVIVSLFFQNSRREGRYTKTLSEFVREPMGSLDTLLEFYNIWAKAKWVAREFCLLRYEDLHNSPSRELRRALCSLGIHDVQQPHIDGAISYSVFENMRKMELSDHFHSFRLRPGNPEDPESFKTRRGKVGGFADYLSSSDIAYMNHKIRTRLSPTFGYGEGAVLAKQTWSTELESIATDSSLEKHLWTGPESPRVVSVP